MKLLPRMNDVFDDFFDDKFFTPNTGAMRADITEKDNCYELNMELAGYNKDDVKISLKDGYLNIAANTHHEDDEKDDAGNVIRRERYRGSCSRSFYVGEGIHTEDVNAKFENGELIVDIPKNMPERIEENHYITIH